MKKALLLVALAAAETALCLYLLAHYFYFATDWLHTFYPATRLLLHGQNPYAVPTLHNPIWTLLPLVPFALLGPAFGALALFPVGFLCFGLVAYKLQAKPAAWLAFLLSPFVVMAVTHENIDPLVVVGLLLPAPVGLFFAAMKPQIGVAMAVYWAWQAWQAGGIRKVATTFLPVALALAASFLFYGNWLTGQTDDVLHVWWNLSLFPWSIPVGAFLLYWSIRKHRVSSAIAASPFLSPYVAVYSWSVAAVGLLEYQFAALGVTAFLWAAFFLFR